MAIGDVWELGVRGSIAGQTIANVFHYVELSGSGGSPEDLVAVWEAGVKTAYLNVEHNLYQLVDYAVRKSNNPAFGQVIIPVSGAAAGQRAGALGYLGGAAVITWRTGLAGRSKRGRTYIGPLSESDVTNGSMEAAYSTALTTFAQAADNVLGADPEPEYTPVVWSRLLLSGAAITGFTVRGAARSQRRRNLGVGA